MWDRNSVYMFADKRDDPKYWTPTESLEEMKDRVKYGTRVGRVTFYKDTLRCTCSSSCAYHLVPVAQMIMEEGG